MNKDVLISNVIHGLGVFFLILTFVFMFAVLLMTLEKIRSLEKKIQEKDLESEFIFLYLILMPFITYYSHLIAKENTIIFFVQFIMLIIYVANLPIAIFSLAEIFYTEGTDSYLVHKYLKKINPLTKEQAKLAKQKMEEEEKEFKIGKIKKEIEEKNKEIDDLKNKKGD
ncbi:hypothetical protein SS41_23215 [Enterobacter hormaechei subsp. xiangfangensis]|uniref:hypothetical protein n=1 Tax=Enterobacter hormaechei TaxID=158836 RepID=UPI0005F09845|nr:hypothetical protein [Enterobacter hormaechei]KJN19167.1 hypothetical protein SS41_23215 [Enterobacter hormaechei subsp. xiangfangensis]